MTLIDFSSELSNCPWCGRPGRVISIHMGGEEPKFQAGCVNLQCPVMPRTKKIFVIGLGAELAREKIIKIWETRE